jgi:hypothetical protein
MIGISPEESAALEEGMTLHVDTPMNPNPSEEVRVVSAKEWEQILFRLHTSETRVDALEGQVAEAKNWSDIVTEDFNKLATQADKTDLALNEVIVDINRMRGSVSENWCSCSRNLASIQECFVKLRDKATQKRLLVTHIIASAALGLALGDVIAKIVILYFK